MRVLYICISLFQDSNQELITSVTSMTRKRVGRQKKCVCIPDWGNRFLFSV
jgi:hypothetical protein